MTQWRVVATIEADNAGEALDRAANLPGDFRSISVLERPWLKDYQLTDGKRELGITIGDGQVFQTIGEDEE